MRKTRTAVFGMVVSAVTLLSSPAWAAPQELCWIYSWPHC